MVRVSQPFFLTLSPIICGQYKVNHKYVNYMDSLRIYCRGGMGGYGLPRLGGIGGNGGAVYVVGGNKETNLRTLKHENPSKRFIAGNGGNAQVHMLQGELGSSVEIKVPLGVCLVTDTGKVLGDINKSGESLLIAKGGAGANVSNGFTPEKGDIVQVKLDLKLIADIGLVGFPNAGKSTLLNAVSRARPRIASYPFTTLHPSVGMLVYDDNRQISMADLPGLIEGAHYNAGLGHKFLKHVERTKLLLYIVDIQGFQLSLQSPRRSALEMVVLLNKELELYKPELLNKPAMLCINKIDTENALSLCSQLRADIEQLQRVGSHEQIPRNLLPKQLQQFDDVMEISAKYGTNTDSLMNKLRELLDVYADLNTDFTNQLDKIYSNKYLQGYKFDVT